MQQRFPELADVLVFVAVADDAVDLARDANVAAAHVTDDPRARRAPHLVRVGADPVMIFDRGLDPDILGKLDAHPFRKVRGSCRNVRYSAGLHSQKCRPNGSFLMISERADRSTIFDGMPVPPLGLATECPILPSEVAFGCRNAWLNQIG